MVNRAGKPTIEDVGREAGVSDTTVSYVLSGSKYAETIPVHTRKRVIDAARKLGYSRSVIGAALQRGYSDIIVLLVVTWELATAHADTIVSISQAAAAEGLTVILHVATDDSEGEAFLPTVPSLHPYGLLLLWDSAQVPGDQIEQLQKMGVPIVDLMPSGLKSVVMITSDREQGVYLTTNHLTELGHRKIAMMVDPECRVRTSERKLIGYRRALESAGIDFDEDLLQMVYDPSFEAGYEAVTKIVTRRPDITGIVALNDSLALGAITAGEDMGLSVPRDLSVVGYGATSEGAHFRPKLTSVANPGTRIAEFAVKTLIRSRTENGFEPTSLLEPMQLVVRESTAPPRT